MCDLLYESECIMRVVGVTLSNTHIEKSQALVSFFCEDEGKGFILL
jgi:hypothetical protein